MLQNTKWKYETCLNRNNILKESTLIIGFYNFDLIPSNYLKYILTSLELSDYCRFEGRKLILENESRKLQERNKEVLVQISLCLSFCQKRSEIEMSSFIINLLP